MSDEQKKILEQKLWDIANTLRGKIDADEFRDYILGFIFYKYLSDKQYLHANQLLKTEKVKDYINVTDKSDIQSIKEDSLEALGYFLPPEDLFNSIAQKGKDKTNGKSGFIISDVERILRDIEQSTMGTDSEDDFIKLFEDLDLNSTKLGRTPDARNEIIARIFSHLDGIDFDLENPNSEYFGRCL